MNLNDNPTIEQLQQIIALAESAAGRHCLWVDTLGVVHLDLIPTDMTPSSFEYGKPQMRIRFETFSKELNNCGSIAAKNLKYINRLLSDLTSNWDKVKHAPPGNVLYL